MKDIDPIDLLKTQKIDENRVSEGFQERKNAEKRENRENPGFWRISRKYPKN